MGSSQCNVRLSVCLSVSLSLSVTVSISVSVSVSKGLSYVLIGCVCRLVPPVMMFRSVHPAQPVFLSCVLMMSSDNTIASKHTCRTTQSDGERSGDISIRHYRSTIPLCKVRKVVRRRRQCVLLSILSFVSLLFVCYKI